jgi:hypothetical protein
MKSGIPLIAVFGIQRFYQYMTFSLTPAVESPHAGKGGIAAVLPAWVSEYAGAYFFLPATCFAAMVCCFFCMAPLALTCFCDACLLVDFGDLSPMMFIFRPIVQSPAALPVSP